MPLNARVDIWWGFHLTVQQSARRTVIVRHGLSTPSNISVSPRRFSHLCVPCRLPTAGARTVSLPSSPVNVSANVSDNVSLIHPTDTV